MFSCFIAHACRTVCSRLDFAFCGCRVIPKFSGTKLRPATQSLSSGTAKASEDDPGHTMFTLTIGHDQSQLTLVIDHGRVDGGETTLKLKAAPVHASRRSKF